jgi:hypothetical protein
VRLSEAIEACLLKDNPHPAGQTEKEVPLLRKRQASRAIFPVPSAALVNVIDANDVIFPEICAALYLDQFDGLRSEILKSMLGPQREAHVFVAVLGHHCGERGA